MNSGVLIYLITPLLSAISQLILKKAADNPKYTGIRAYLNVPVVLAYGLFFGCMLLNDEYQGRDYHIRPGQWDDWQGPDTIYLCEWDYVD